MPSSPDLKAVGRTVVLRGVINSMSLIEAMARVYAGLGAMVDRQHHSWRALSLHALA